MVPANESRPWRGRGKKAWVASLDAHAARLRVLLKIQYKKSRNLTVDEEYVVVLSHHLVDTMQRYHRLRDSPPARKEAKQASPCGDVPEDQSVHDVVRAATIAARQKYIEASNLFRQSMDTLLATQ